MSTWNWNGARWWQCDLHAHTPASEDYGKGPQQNTLKARTPREWLLDYMRAGVDCVAITDHNTGAWIDQLKAALIQLRSAPPDDFRPMILFPGVEISVNGGIHVLAILGTDRGTSDVDTLLGVAGFSGTKGKSEDVTTKSFTEVVQAITDAGGIAIPAHVDESNGLFRLQGPTLGQALDSERVFAIEVVNTSSPKPQLYIDKQRAWTEILGSDAHHPTGRPGQRFAGSHFTWVKMSSPNIEGLRLALLDGPLSVRRSDQRTTDPNGHAPLLLESIEIASARYMGRPDPFTIRLNPWLTTIVGGRGTGKSSLVEFLRLAMRRGNEIPDDLQSEFEKYSRIYPNRDDGGLLTADVAIRVVYRKNGYRFRVQWDPNDTLDSIQQDADATWASAEGEVYQRFPIRIYSQKQIFHLARTPLALLRIIDDAPEVDRRSWSDRWQAESSRFLSLRVQARALESGIADGPRLRGELDDVKRKLAIFEAAGHADVLRAFQRRKRQQQTVDDWEATWTGLGDHVRELTEGIVPAQLDESDFDGDAAEEEAIRHEASRVMDQLIAIRTSLEGHATEIDRIVADWKAQKSASDWSREVGGAIDAYQQMRERLAAEGAGDPGAYGDLVHRRQAIEQRLRELDEKQSELDDLQGQAVASLSRLLQIRRELTEARRRFLDDVLRDNPYVQIRVVPYQARNTAEGELRRLLHRDDGSFEKDIGSPTGLFGELYTNSGTAEAMEATIAGVKKKIRDIAQGEFDLDMLGDRRFAAHLERLEPEALDRVDLWFPEDSLDVQYSPTGDGDNFRSIKEGSPGQKTAALLAFLLSYGEEPLVLDQPEDDLDNHLIYDLIVTQLREVKGRRQVIVVTHNANIVVNGDAELVVAMVVHNGQTHVECDGSLQERSVRNTICAVMEGGREAFERRYRRIALETKN